jgi:hypothetical protein
MLGLKVCDEVESFEQPNEGELFISPMGILVLIKYILDRIERKVFVQEVSHGDR